MAIDLNNLNINNITPEIMAQMSRAEIEAFKTKLTPEQFQALADKMGGSQVEAPEIPDVEISIPKTNSNQVETSSTLSHESVTNPTEQKGPIIFGRQ